MACNQSFEVHGDDGDALAEYAYVAENMLSLSQLHCQPLGDNNEHINATQYDNEVGEYAMESNQYVHETCTYPENKFHNNIVEPHVVKGFQALQRQEE